MNPAQIIDISILMRNGIAPWPDDVPYALRVESLGALHLGSVSMSVHSGTHVDAPFHFLPQGASAEALDLDPFLGPCSVIDVSGKDRIQVLDIEGSGVKLTPRILLRTNAWLDYTQFPESIPVIESYVPAFLKERGVTLLGIDLPSVDAIESKELPIHHALSERGIQILESLNLQGASPGNYELVALPLRLEGADASPCRAVLLS